MATKNSSVDVEAGRVFLATQSLRDQVRKGNQVKWIEPGTQRGGCAEVIDLNDQPLAVKVVSGKKGKWIPAHWIDRVYSC